MRDDIAAASRRVMELVAAWDSLRLSTYRDQEWLEDRIRVGSVGNAITLRFDDDAAFNRVYAPDKSVLERIGEVEDFYRGSWHGCELICAENGAIQQPGAAWREGSQYAWLHASPVPVPGPRPETIRAPGPDERLRFVETWMRAFDVEDEATPFAIRNMRHLFRRPQLDFLMAMEDEQPVATGALYQRGPSALLAGAATLQASRQRGHHSALLAARLQLAAEAGCTEVGAFVAAGGVAQRNLERAGLRAVGLTRSWRLLPSA